MERIKVKLHSNMNPSVEATKATIKNLPGGNHSLIQDGDDFFIETDNPGFVRFSVVRQGYVKAIVD